MDNEGRNSEPTAMIRSDRLTQPRVAVARPDGAGADAPRFDSIEELFEALESPLLSYAQRLLPDNNMAEDTVQEAFVRLHAQFDQVRAPRSWLYRTVHNLAVNQQRQAGKIVPLDPQAQGSSGPSSDPADPQPLPDEQIARWEGIGLVRLSLQCLDGRSRELIRLKFTEDLSYKQISERTGLSVGNVGYLLHHSLKSLAAELAKAGLVP
jgi:RNA polymerase sigma factor (sigma-70 family)